MNPQSQKVLESNPKLDSKNTRESKKIQRVKNTYDSTNSQKSKESSKVKTLIRTIPISIALASALSSHAVAAWQFGSLQASGSGLPSSTGTISGEDLIVDGLTIDLRNYWVGINNYLYGVARNGTGGNLTINNNSKIEVYKMSGPLIKIDGNATAGIITNNGIINRDDTGTSSVRATVDVGTNASVEAFINTGTIIKTHFKSKFFSFKSNYFDLKLKI